MPNYLKIIMDSDTRLECLEDRLTSLTPEERDEYRMLKARIQEAEIAHYAQQRRDASPYSIVTMIADKHRVEQEEKPNPTWKNHPVVWS